MRRHSYFSTMMHAPAATLSPPRRVFVFSPPLFFPTLNAPHPPPAFLDVVMICICLYTYVKDFIYLFFVEERERKKGRKKKGLLYGPFFPSTSDYYSKTIALALVVLFFVVVVRRYAQYGKGKGGWVEGVQSTHTGTHIHVYIYMSEFYNPASP